MNKIAILGDVHAGASKSSDIIHDYFEKFYEFFFEYLVKNDIHTIIQVGDLYDQRKDVHFNTLHRFEEYFLSKLKKFNIKMYVLAGNHDATFKNSNRITSVRLLATDMMETIDTHPKTIIEGSEAFDLYPWINQENIKDSLEFAAQSSSPFAFGHFEFAHFPMYPGTIADHGMDHKLFSKYERVFSGHYHTISEKDNILYVGTPCELNWADYNDPKGFWILDSGTNHLEHIRNPYTLFEKISYVEGMDYDFTLVKDKYVKIVVVSKTDQKKFDKFVDSVTANLPHDIKIIETVKVEISEKVVIDSSVSTHTMINTVLDSIDVSVDKTTLKNRVSELYTEALHLTNSL